jgi:phosphoribosylformimino-5-aminoimidazole carboxamide ribotide isomerase
VIPAIDIRGGRCVRLFQGDYDRETRYADDPVEVARRWAAEGASLIHVVDLDGAKDGTRVNGEVVAAICRAVAIPVEVSGGMRSMADVEAAFAGGAARVQIGSAAVRNPELVHAACAAHPGAIVVSVDARDGEAMTDGWTRGSGVRATELAGRMVELGVPRIMYTDISRDGAMEGPNVEALAALVRALPVPVVAAGGITTLEQLEAVAAAGAEGAVLGKALYEGTIRLGEAIAALEGPPARG